jgi:diguanylate cyclase (GGDEF)-like protein
MTLPELADRTTSTAGITPGGDALDPPHPGIDGFTLLRKLQTALEPAGLLSIVSAEIAGHVDHEGLSLLHPAHPAQVGDGGFWTSDWPLWRGQERVGTLRVHSCTALDEAELRTLGLVADLLAQPMANALLCEDLRRHAREDSLTGLYNRAALERMLPRETALAQRERRAISVLMLDLDHFKQVNDRHGHAAGDALLRLFSAVMRECLRESDLAFRYGGEEFVLLLPDSDADGACRAAERISALLKQRAATRLGLEATVSVGVASAGEDCGFCPQRLLRAADRALYLAKDLGRDQVRRA